MKTNKTLAIALITMLSVSGMAYGQGGDGSGTGDGSGGGNQSLVELPANWETMTGVERRAFMKSQGIEGSVTEAERTAAQEARQLENQGATASQGANQNNQSQNRFTRNAKKAANYKRFTKQLREKKQFKDEAKIKNKAAVEFLQRRGILDGYDDGSFGPQNPINRAESLKVLLESLGEAPDEAVESEFSDVPAGAWFAGYVTKAKRKGIVKGYEDGTFQPARTVNQVELLKLAFESFGIDLAGYAITNLPAGTEAGAWYAPYLQYALDNDLLDISAVAPAEGMTREMFSEVIYRLIQQQEALQ